MTTTDIGRLGEAIAVKYLKKNRYKILAKNKHQSHNEIDIIATDRQHIVFVEVKARTVSDDLQLQYSSPASAVTKGKQIRTIQAAKEYLYANQKSKHTKKQPRMDVIEVFLSKDTLKPLRINHIIDAFGI